MIKINLYGLGSIWVYMCLYMFLLSCFVFMINLYGLGSIWVYMSLYMFLLSYFVFMRFWEFLCFVSMWLSLLFQLVSISIKSISFVFNKFLCFSYSIIWGGVFSSPIFLFIAYLFCHHQKGGDCWPKKLHSPFV